VPISSKILSLIAVLLLLAGNAFGDGALVYYNSGFAKFNKGDLDGALTAFNYALQLRPHFAEAYSSRGIVKRAKGDLDGALADSNKAIELNPGLAEFYSNRGIVKKDEGDLDGALADCDKAIELKPDLANAYNNRGMTKHTNGDLDGALADYNKAIALDPDNTHAYNNRGNLKRERGDLDGALADDNKAIELDPKYARAYHSRGCLRYDAQGFSEALIDFQKEGELVTGSAYGHFRLWLIRARLGEEEPATKELLTYLDNRKTGKPDDWQSQIARFLIGQLAEPAFFKATENANKYIERGQLCEAWFYAGTKHLIDGDKATAAEYFNKCLATGRPDFYEYQSAAAELKLLKAGK